MDVEELGTVFVSLGTELNDRELQKVQIIVQASLQPTTKHSILTDGCFVAASCVDHERNGLGQYRVS